MGIARANGRRNNHTQRLTVLALEFDPERPPYFVSQPDQRHPSQGWWWIPQGTRAPAFLGCNHITAETDLRRLSDAHYRTGHG